MENQTQAKQRHIPWAAIGIMFSTFSVIVLIATFCFSFYKVSLVGKQMQRELAAFQNHQTNMQTSIDTIQQQSKQSTDALNQSMAELRQSFNGDKNTWRILEAQYYVKLADAKLQYESNISTAIQLLQAADSEIKDINEPRLDSARKVLAEDIAALQSTPQVDYTGLYMRLSALDQQVDKLPTLIKPTGDVVAPQAIATNEPWWKRGLQNTWKSLQKIVVVRYHATGTLPLVTPEQQDFLIQNCHAMFEKAMWAVLNKQPEIYHASLQQASNWISQYFVMDSAATKNILTNIVELQQIDIHPTVPRVTTSLQAFRDYLANANNSPATRS
jgi:uroporphyrin-3 C-methyltransferase